MILEYIALEDAIADACRSGPVYFFQPTGNWGDALIRYGSRRFFEDIGLEYTELYRDTRHWYWPLLRGGTLIWGGGGAWCEAWQSSANRVTTFSKRFRVLVLPSTYQGTYDYPNVTFWARDRFESLEHMPHARFCHDMAFYLRHIESLEPTEETGFFFRQDHESAGRFTLPPQNVDLSLGGTQLSGIAEFARRASAVRRIYTDRLHVAIMGALLGREVHLFPNVYFKNRAIYWSSLSVLHENIIFHEDAEGLERALQEAG